MTVPKRDPISYPSIDHKDIQGLTMTLSTRATASAAEINGQFHTQVECWERLTSLRHPGFFHSFEWMRLWMKHFAQDRDVRLHTVGDGQAVRLIAPLRTRAVRQGPTSVRITETIGTRHLPNNDLIYDPDGLSGWIDALMQHLASECRTDILRITALPEESPLTDLLRDRSNGLKKAVEVENDACRNRHVMLDADFEAYYASRPKNLRRDQRQGLKRLAKEGSVSTRFYRSIAESPTALDDYFELYSRSWQQSEHWKDFFSEAIALLSSLEKLRLLFLDLDGRAVAGQLALVDNGTLYVLKNFYDESYKRFSPGTILGFDMFARTMRNDQVGSIDYMKGDQPYKARWAESVRVRSDWAIPLTFRGSLALNIKNLVSGNSGNGSKNGDE